MDIQLRVATFTDLPTLDKFQDKLVSFERPFDPTIPKTGKVQYYNIKELVQDSKVHFLVAHVDNKIAGCGFAQIRKNDAEWATVKQTGYIGLMFVDEKFRGKKIGSLLIKNLLHWLSEQKITDVRLKVYAENSSAIHAYKKNGFKDFLVEMRIEIEEE